MMDLQSTLNWSGALRRQLVATPELADWLQAQSKYEVTPTVIQDWFDALRPQEYTEEALKKQLRLVRRRVFFTLMVRDVHSRASLAEVSTAMSFLADLSVNKAYEWVSRALSEAHGTPIDPKTGLPLEMLIVAMGKWGGYELNVSSDIDLITLYDGEGETQGRRSRSYHEYFGRLTQRLLPILSQTNAFGHVFRTDLRLRPDGNVGPLAWSLNALENYFLHQGREWERYAWIKGRLIQVKSHADSQPQYAQQRLENLRTPFVYRKYFDFDALASLRDLRERIRQDWERKVIAKDSLESTHNIKLGDGGIREIEFVVQLNQLIRGGRWPSLQQQNLHAAVHAQVQADLMDDELARRLLNAYDFLRRTEHFLQYKEDEQTHLLPTEADTYARLAYSFGLSTDSFTQQLNEHRQFVHQSFQDAFRIAGVEKKTQTATAIAPVLPSPPISSSEHAELEAQSQQLLHSNRIQRLPPHSLKRLQRLLPLLRQAACATDHPVETNKRLHTIMEQIASRSAYLALLLEYPETIQRMATIAGASPWAAHYLAQYPLVLDSLIEWKDLLEAPDFTALAEQLRLELDACVLPNGQADIERQMNLMRDLQHQVSFQLLAQDIAGLLTVEVLADQLSALADLLIEETIYRTWPLAQPRQQPPDPPTPQFAVIAYGKLGGKELGYASDLDLVFLYDDPNQDQVEKYVRLGRRMVSWLSTMTSSGRMYEVDMRLRPDGDAGLIAVSIDGFEKYQSQQAWSWEHQAITRARFVAGDPQIGARFEKVRQDILLQKRDPIAFKREVITMREKIAQAHPNKSDLFDIKHDRGGMVDIEFMTQYLVLCYAHRYPALLNNLGNIALLGIAAEHQLIPRTLSQQAIQAYRTFRRYQHNLRLQGAAVARLPLHQVQAERDAVMALWQAVMN
ncbi:MAG: bifunctional [glutamate--ammonia ligase]-adenylyl-L-tyrosine phosphorylase/[glutamate--ammonia-ligase] adenylyltransferase [Alcaligenaceae bacterium]|nr:bifunctional [glutamate--ammonia ligase]-adenylyl-L-tyrosine phosphorylase/[glutamate--ammonia-ligase] adenylyltransferase [Alcaligenaceae bacterium]